MTAITATHRSILTEIGIEGIEPERLRSHGREFQELQREGLNLFWPIGGTRPQGIFGGGVVPGRWYLSAAGGALLEPPELRLS